MKTRSKAQAKGKRSRAAATSSRKRSAAQKTTKAKAKRLVSRVRRAVVGSRPTRRTTAQPQDAISFLREDHRRLRTLLEALQTAASAERRSRAIEQAEDALKMHTKLEEEFFYPAFREAARDKRDRQMFHEATEEHHTVDVVLPEVKQAAYEPDVFAARAKVLKELVEHHISEEQDELFPRARKLLPASQLKEIGLRMAERQHAAAKPAGALQAVGAMIGLGS
jgi:hemerythrin-like domain-containing protein